MNRLTEKYNDNYVTKKYFVSKTIMEDCHKAIQKLGKLEDIFELIELMYKKPVCYKVDNGESCSDDYTDSTILYNPKTNEIEIYEYDFIARYKVEEYGTTWWLKGDKSE